MPLNKHLFALHTTTAINETGAIRDEALQQRIIKILRLRVGSKVLLFNKAHTATVTLSEQTFTSKNTIHGEIKNLAPIVPMTPTITLLQAIPKRSVFEEIIYNAAQLGVTTIVPIRSSKAHELDFTPKEHERFRNIMITACEQAKQFIIPTITAPVSFEEAIKNSEPHIKILFDSNGKPFSDLLSLCKKTSLLTVLFGPEGGLTEQEITTAQTAGFTITQLTPTILRSEDAPLVGIGILRTLTA